jgi:hypothetical protein
MGFYMEIFEARVLGENIDLHQSVQSGVLPVYYSDHAQYTPSFNKVCYTLRLQGCFL